MTEKGATSPAASEPQDHAGEASVWAAIYVGAAVVAFVSVLPMMVGVLARDLGLGDQRAGYLVAGDRAGGLIGTLVGVLLLRRRSGRTVVVTGLCGLIAGNVATGFFSAFESLFVCRFAAGIAQGTVSAFCYATLGRSSRPARAFSFYCALQLILGSVGSLLIPGLVQAGGWRAPFYALAALVVPGLAVASLLSARAGGPPPAPQRGPNRGSWAAWAILGSILSFFIGAGGLYAYLERIGEAGRLSGDVIARSLSVASLAGLAGALLVGFAAHRLGRARGAALGGAMCFASIAAFLLPTSEGMYWAATAAFVFAWDFFYPFQFAILAEADRRGAVTALTPAATGSGLAAGPALAALLLDRTGPGGVPLLGLGMSVVSFSLLFLVAYAIRRRTPYLAGSRLSPTSEPPSVA